MFVGEEPIPRLTESVKPAPVIGEGALGRASYVGADFNQLAERLIAHSTANPDDMGLLLDISLVLQMAFRREEGLAAQRAALSRRRLYRVFGNGSPPREGWLRVLALTAPGDLMTNTPIEFIAEGLPVRLDLLFIDPDRPLPEAVPDHDVAFMAVAQSDEQEALLRRIAGITARWPRPMIQNPLRVLETSREGVYRALAGAGGIVVPPVARVSRALLLHVAAGTAEAETLGMGLRFPILLRPVGSHAGKGLERIDDPASAGRYLERIRSGGYYVTQFVSYGGHDGLHRKYRVALVDGRPFLCHMAISESWMLHYANAGMEKSQAKRDEEARAMETFETGFARRHERALEEIYRRVGLEYLVIDCGESPDGRLLLFEADAAMVIHSMDPPDLFPYKKAHMERVFQAFYAMLAAKAGRAAAGSTG